MVYPTPTKRSQSSSLEVAPSEISREEWISSFLLKTALRPRWRSLPLVWMVVVSAVVFPIGMWNQMDSISNADEAPSVNSSSAAEAPTQAPTESKAQVETQAAPDSQAKPEATQAETPTAAEAATASAPIQAPASDSAPESSATVASPASALPALPDPTVLFSPPTRKLRVQVIVSGKVLKREIEVPEKATVKDAIEAFDLTLNQYDRVEPAPGTPTYHGQKIRITRVRTEEKTRTVSIPSELRFRPTAAMRPGEQKVEQAGRTGIIEVKERVWFKDGKVSGREALGKTTVREAQDKVIAVGARPYYVPGKVPYHNRYARAYSLAARAGSPRDRITSHETKTLRPVKSIVLTATGYSPHPSENGGYTVTATGLPISYGAAAVDPRVIPLGTKLYVEGYGYAFACDVGGAIKGNRIDLAYDSYRYANTKGRKKVKVWILAP